MLNLLKNLGEMKYDNIIEFTVGAKYASFNNPIMKVGGEKFSYPVPTYEAIKGILKNIYWKPTIDWFPDKVRIMNKIEYFATSEKKRWQKQILNTSDLCYNTRLVNVEYQIQAHFEWNMFHSELEQDRNEMKHFEIAKRALKLGGRLNIFLGTSECGIDYIIPQEFGSGQGYYDGSETKEIGPMFHGFTYPNQLYPKNFIDKYHEYFDIKEHRSYCDKTSDGYNEDNGVEYGNIYTRFWNPKINNGIIDFIRPEDCNHIQKGIRVPIKRYHDKKEVI